MNEYRKLESAILYFADEAFGFRKSLHHYHRYITTGEQSELESLIIEVGREHFIDFRPLIDAVNNKDSDSLWNIIEILIEHGPYLPAGWNPNSIKLQSGDKRLVGLLKNSNNVGEAENLLWALNNWVNDNTSINNNQIEPVALLAYAVSRVAESRIHFFKIIDLVELFIGNRSILACMIKEDLKFFGQAVSAYYNNVAESVNDLTGAMSSYPKLNWTDALSRNQIKSKVWLLEKLKAHNLEPTKASTMFNPGQTSVVVGGWVGMLPFLASITGTKLGAVINVDIDSSVHDAANMLNFTSSSMYANSDLDVKEFDFTKYKKLLVIDTIVEHFENHGEWVSTLPAGTTVILQGNNMFDVPDHVNCHKTLEEFISSCGLNSVLWAGELNLYKCTRFMAIGKI